MKNILLYLTFIIPVIALGQENQNYIKTIVYKVPTLNGTTNSDSGTTLTSEEKATEVTYFDGMGRPIQKIAVGQSESNKDIVVPFEYDNFGRQVKEYLPYVTSDDTSVNGYDAIAAQAQFYSNPTEAITGNPAFESTNYAYSENKFEDSPISRIYEQAAPGNPWALSQGHTVKFEQYSNGGDIKKFSVSFPSNSLDSHSLIYSGFYKPNQLYKTIIKDRNWVATDEQNKTTEEYKDKEGKIILKRVYNNGAHDTYYVYDRFSNLCYVIPPSASDNIVKNVFVYNIFNFNYPWTRLALVDSALANAYEKELSVYDNSQLLDIDLMDRYQGMGGFSIYSNESGNVVLDININTVTPMSLKTGEIMRLDDAGTFQDKELGVLKGSGFEYYFLILNNALVVRGSGKIPTSVTASLNGYTTLDYKKNYPWTKILKGDSNIMGLYEKDIANLDNNDILTTFTPNDYNASGGVSVTLDEDDTVNVSINISSDVALEINNGSIIPFDFNRRVDDRELGTISGDGFNYKISIRDNALYFSGSGLVKHITFTRSVGYISKVVRSEVVQGLCYIYYHDAKNRIRRKHIPGNGWTYMVYDKLDRLVMTQDENQRVKTINNWSFTKYDKYNRSVYSGLCTSIDTQSNIQQMFDTASVISESRQTSLTSFGDTSLYYSKLVYPTTGTLLTIQYYDDYQFGEAIPTQNSLGKAITNSVKGLQTGDKVRVLEANTNVWNTSINGYDDKGRNIWNKEVNSYLGIIDITNMDLNFRGLVLQNQTQHTKTGSTFTINDYFKYDHADRLLKHYQKIGNNAYELITFNKYDELGQLIKKKVGGAYNSSASAFNTYTSNYLQQVDYNYNVRGWLKGINDINENLNASGVTDLFAFKINYETKDESTNTYPVLYNSNIIETRWKTKNDNTIRSYGYNYDALNRLKNATTTSNVLYNGTPENFTENISYDKNGNIVSLQRYGIKTGTDVIDKIDDLVYTNTAFSNRLQAVKDNAQVNDGFVDGDSLSIEYSYDNNGNLISDKNKGIASISYYHLNLPEVITFDNGNTIKFVYDASGVKLRKIINEGSNITITDYDEGFVYQKVNSGSTILQYISHTEGYIEVNSGIYSYIYQYKDHLGNIRLSYKKNTSGGLDILEERNYYPFGLSHDGYNQNTSSTNLALKYRYNGKEIQDELGLNTYDYGARNYDPALGRWINVDPLAEIMESVSPYAYAFNNPIYFRDTEGAAPKALLSPYLIFNGKHNKLYIYDDNGTPDDKSDDILLGSFRAHNIVAKASQGKWEDGRYDMYDKNTRRTREDTEIVQLPLFYSLFLEPNVNLLGVDSYTDIMVKEGVKVKQDSQYGRYGEGGIYRAVSFTQSDGLFRSGMAIHAGREYKSFFSRVTNGCIRTVPEALIAIDNAIKEYGPLTTITVEDNKPPVSPKVKPINVTPMPVIPLPIPKPTPVPIPTPIPAPRPIPFPTYTPRPLN